MTGDDALAFIYRLLIEAAHGGIAKAHQMITSATPQGCRRGRSNTSFRDPRTDASDNGQVLAGAVNGLRSGTRPGEKDGPAAEVIAVSASGEELVARGDECACSLPPRAQIWMSCILTFASMCEPVTARNRRSGAFLGSPSVLWRSLVGGIA
jgi:hypothetical protein